MARLNRDSFAGPSFSFSNRVARSAWKLVYLLLFRPSPRSLHAWRAFLLRIFGARIGRNCHIYPRATIWAPWNLECGDEVGVGDNTILYNQAPITLGRRVVISQGAHLCTGTHDYETEGFPVRSAPIIVGSQAWIAAEAFVLPGVSIGEGCIVGARSVVTKDLPAWHVCVGHPCKALRSRREIDGS